MNKKKTTFGISFPDERLLLAAKAKAQELGITFSAYVNQLIRKDLHLRNVFSQEDAGELHAAEDPSPYGAARDALTEGLSVPSKPATGQAQPPIEPAKGKRAR